MKLNVKTIGSKVLAAAAALAVVGASTISHQAHALASGAEVAEVAKALSTAEAGALRTFLTSNASFAQALTAAGAGTILQAKGALNSNQTQLLQNALSSNPGLAVAINAVAKGMPTDAAQQAAYFAKIQNVSVNSAVGVVARSTSDAAGAIASNRVSEGAQALSLTLESQGKALGVNTAEAVSAINSLPVDAQQVVGRDAHCVAQFKTAEGVGRVAKLFAAVKGALNWNQAAEKVVGAARGIYGNNLAPACAGLMAGAKRIAAQIRQDMNAVTCQIAALPDALDMQVCPVAAR